jgi:hypothetical protein
MENGACRVASLVARHAMHGQSQNTIWLFPKCIRRITAGDGQVRRTCAKRPIRTVYQRTQTLSHRANRERSSLKRSDPSHGPSKKQNKEKASKDREHPSTYDERRGGTRSGHDEGRSGAFDGWLLFSVCHHLLCKALQSREKPPLSEHRTCSGSGCAGTPADSDNGRSAARLPNIEHCTSHIEQ